MSITLERQTRHSADTETQTRLRTLDKHTHTHVRTRRRKFRHTHTHYRSKYKHAAKMKTRVSTQTYVDTSAVRTNTLAKCTNLVTYTDPFFTHKTTTHTLYSSLHMLSRQTEYETCPDIKPYCLTNTCILNHTFTLKFFKQTFMHFKHFVILDG